MKRSGPIQRRTPLAAGQPLKRGEPMKRGVAVKPKRATPRRREAPRWSAADWAWVTHVLMIRSRGRCEKCGRPSDRWERHHRKRRRDGGDTFENVMLLDPECHRYITEHPGDARRHGWIVSVARDPAEVPVWIEGDWWRLLADGTKERALAIDGDAHA